MTILLDIDGVLVTTPPWKDVEIGKDGFMLFNKASAQNLADILTETNAAVVLTNTHRVNYSIEKWKAIFKERGISINVLTKINDVTAIDDMQDRRLEVIQWVELNGQEKNYVILDDDPTLNNLPSFMKNKWITTKPFVGIDDEVKRKTLKVLLKRRK